MRKVIGKAVVACLVASLAGCSVGTKLPDPVRPTDSDYELTLSFAKGASNPDNPIYAAWIENSTRDFLRYIYVCDRLLNDSEKPNIPARKTCPFWRIGIYDTALDDGIDVVSGATNTASSFSTAPITLPAGSPSRFTAYFEIDRSFDGNDWWTDQPAIVYAAEVELDGSATKTFALTARGWSRNAGGGSGGNENRISGNPPAGAVGALQAEMRYITNGAASGGTAFGAPYAGGSPENAANMVGSLTLAATKK